MTGHAASGERASRPRYGRYPNRSTGRHGIRGNSSTTRTLVGFVEKGSGSRAPSSPPRDRAASRFRQLSPACGRAGICSRALLRIRTARQPGQSVFGEVFGLRQYRRRDLQSIAKPAPGSLSRWTRKDANSTKCERVFGCSPCRADGAFERHSGKEKQHA